MKIIGLTGSIASGKSTVASMLNEKGAITIDADLIARDVVEPGKPAWKEIVDRFGDTILRPNREIDRRMLGNIVFKDPESLAFLNSVIHPWVIAEIDEKIKRMKNEFSNGEVVVLDVPLLIEVGMHKQSNLTVVVSAQKSIRFERLLKQGYSEEEAENRIVSQSGKEELEKQADVIIENSGTLDELRKKVDDLWRLIQSN